MQTIPKWLKILAWLAVAVWAGTIFWLSSRTGSQIEELNIFEIGDKVAHFAAFLVGGALVSVALRWSTDWPWPRIFWTAALAVALFGATDEYHQTFTVNRSGADVFDWLADALGGVAGAFLTPLTYARFARGT